jgi:hypothetical protein
LDLGFLILDLGFAPPQAAQAGVKVFSGKESF